MGTSADRSKPCKHAACSKHVASDRPPAAHTEEIDNGFGLPSLLGNQAMLRLLQTQTAQRGASSMRAEPPQPPFNSDRPPSHPQRALTIQTKLSISSPGDQYEREADRIADRVMRMPESGAPSPCACGGGASACDEETLDRKPEAVQLERVQTADTGQMAVPSSVHDTLNSSGQPLDAPSRAFFERRFAHDFGAVRIHTDAQAAASARAIQARAYTAGHNIVFGPGEYAPATTEGKRLLAHELTHVLQQQGVRHDAGPGSVVQRQTAATGGTAPACATRYAPARSFAQLIDLVRAAETRLAAAGITLPADQIHALRGIYYGTTWSLDYSVERSTTRNEGFQRFTRPSMDPARSVPPDVRSALDCGLFDALRSSQDIVDPSGRHVDFGHLVIGLDARSDPRFTAQVQYPVTAPLVGTINIPLGGTGTELVTWLGDLGGGAASLAVRRVGSASTTASAVFSGSDYGGSINLEGDIAASVVATPSASTAPTAPSFGTGRRLSDALTDYLSPAAPSAAWNDRVTAFLRLNGATFDASGALTNETALIARWSGQIQEFACNYLASRVRDSATTGITRAQAIAAADHHVVTASREVATTFMWALVDARASGGRVEARRFPAASPPGASACGMQITAARAASAVGF